MADEFLKHLYDIREATAAIFRFIAGKTFEDYEQNELLRSGIERKLEIIGEALHRIRRDDPALLVTWHPPLAHWWWYLDVLAQLPDLSPRETSGLAASA